MSGSIAEERIRAKAEAMLRVLFPQARIVHELVLQQGGCRIDLAAVCPDYLALIEIKSERDVLDRLPSQAKAALRVGDLFGICVAAKHVETVKALRDGSRDDRLSYDAHILPEIDDGFETRFTGFHDGWGTRERCQPRLCNPADRLEMLWADELRAIARIKAPRQGCKRAAIENMTGREVRRAVCAALRTRHFPRADAPVAEMAA